MNEQSAIERMGNDARQQWNDLHNPKYKHIPHLGVCYIQVDNVIVYSKDDMVSCLDCAMGLI